MKTTLRNFFVVLRRFKMAMFLNIAGLGIAFTAFMMIVMQVKYDHTFDACQPQAPAIYRLDMAYPSTSLAVVSLPFARAFTASSPHIQAGTVLSAWNARRFFSVRRGGETYSYEEGYYSTTPDITRVFHFDMLEGDENALEAPDTWLIPRSMARRLFGEETARGKAVFDPDTGEMLATIGGVYHDFPSNSTLPNLIYRRLPDQEDLAAWTKQNYYFFFRLDDPARLEEVKANFKRNFDLSAAFGALGVTSWEKDGVDLQLTALPELHFLTKVEYDTLPKASREATGVLLAIAWVILLIAGINFTNFSTALAPMRIKSINTRKVLGSSAGVLRAGLLLETVLVSVAAFGLSLGILAVLGQTSAARLVDADLSIGGQPLVVGATGALAVVMGLVVGLYPARYVTSFAPALVLKGNFGLSPKGRQLRSLLVGVQFVASFVLIIVAAFMYLQNRFMEKAPLGYEKDQLIVAGLNRKANEKLEALGAAWKQFAGIEEVAYAEQVLSSRDQFMGWGRDYKDRQIDFQCIPVSPSFLQTLGIEVSQGRGFRPEDDRKETGSYIFNRTAAEQYGLAVGERIEGEEIVGLMPDVKFASLRTEVSPMAFYVWGKYVWGEEKRPFYAAAYVRVKAGSDLRAAMAHVKETLAATSGAYPFRVRFYDEVLQQTYEKERQTGWLISSFSLLAVFISIVGVFGLVVFESEYRRKEVGVRKVLGATTGEMLAMFNRGYLAVLAVCYVLAAPVAYYGVGRWLEGFAYRTPVAWWVFAAAFAAVAAVTLLTVTFQTWRVAAQNPAEVVSRE